MRVEACGDFLDSIEFGLELHVFSISRRIRALGDGRLIPQIAIDTENDAAIQSVTASFARPKDVQGTL
ncbi:hypothetical protein GCM10008012_21860 [Rhizobium anhuiense]|nr:hypothetical protein GCM10008012_21860 [Rhizobium anhuiense]